jgi:G3E family GTPase
MTAPAVPLTIIAGFLGTGKTALLNHLLSHAGGRRLAALVNDFGALNIDSELIAARHGGQIALANGCVCCSIGDDLALALHEVMRQTPRPDHILIEASGVADPARIAGFAAVDRELRLDTIVTLVDATAHDGHARDPYLADNYQRQIAAANLFLLSKTDIATPEQRRAARADLTAQRASIPQLLCTHGQIDSDIILEPMLHDRPAPCQTDSATHMPNVAHDFARLALTLPFRVPRDELAAKLTGLAPDLLRAKGILQDEQGAYVLHYAVGRIDISAFDGTPSGHFVIIGRPGLTEKADSLALASISEPA